MNHPASVLVMTACCFVAAGNPCSASNQVDVINEDAARFSKLIESRIPERRIQGIQGFSHLKHQPAETALIRLLVDPAPAVRQQSLIALTRLGTTRSIPQLIHSLDEPSWDTREHARLGLQRMTGRDFGITNATSKWSSWWEQFDPHKEMAALLAATTGKDQCLSRAAALRAMRHIATPDAESEVLQLLHESRSPPWAPNERAWLCETLERIGSARAVPILAREQSDAAAWALGRIGGVDAEAALLQFPKTLAVWLALDRLESTRCGPFIPQLVGQMGLITFRGQPDDVMNEETQPIQRVSANLIRRSGQAPLLHELVIQELEDSMKPPIEHGPRPACPAEWEVMLKAMRSELKPGFIREDGVTTSQPIAALCYSADDPAFAKRLIRLLAHPAFVPRVYIALTLGNLKCQVALPQLVSIIRQGYDFSDATALASGKHFEQSQTVRWRGFLCLALGRFGCDDARQELERLAADPSRTRDVRYGAVTGLGFIRSTQSLAALKQIAANDLIWMVRDAAERTIHEIETKLEP